MVGGLGCPGGESKPVVKAPYRATKRIGFWLTVVNNDMHFITQFHAASPLGNIGKAESNRMDGEP